MAESMSESPTAIEILDAIERKGFALTLEVRGTSQKWVTGKNLFMGMNDPHGLRVRDACGPLSIEMPLRVGGVLSWEGEAGERLDNHTQALRHTIKAGKVRRQ